MHKERLGRAICAAHQRVRLTSAKLSGFDEPMREPRQYESPLCAQTGAGDYWFPEPGQGTITETVLARSICNQCSHKTECAEWAIKYEHHGIWGGLTERERKQIRRKRRITVGREQDA